MTHPVYAARPFPKLRLSQGTILGREKLRTVLKGHQDYFAESEHFAAYVVVTQSCDLEPQQLADYIYLAVIRQFEGAFVRRDVEKRYVDGTRRTIREMLNHAYNRRGYFYLPQCKDHGVEEDWVVDLRVMFSLDKKHYQELLDARTGLISELYAAAMGSIAGRMFHRVALSSWRDLYGVDADQEANERVRLLEKREDKNFEDLGKKRYLEQRAKRGTTKANARETDETRVLRKLKERKKKEIAKQKDRDKHQKPDCENGECTNTAVTYRRQVVWVNGKRELKYLCLCGECVMAYDDPTGPFIAVSEMS